MRLPVLLPLLVLPLMGCDDEFNQDWAAIPDTVQIFSLSRAEYVGRPSAYDFALDRVPVVVEDLGATGSWDLALIDQAGGVLALAPASAFSGITSRAGIATVSERTFENVDRAPSDTSVYKTTPVPIQLGQIYVVRTRRADCGFTSGVRYAKLEPLEVNSANGSLRFRTVVNPFCNDRRLIPPD